MSVIVNLHHSFVIVKPVKTAHVLLESTAPGDGMAKKRVSSLASSNPSPIYRPVDRITRSFESGTALIDQPPLPLFTAIPPLRTMTFWAIPLSCRELL